MPKINSQLGAEKPNFICINGNSVQSSGASSLLKFLAKYFPPLLAVLAAFSISPILQPQFIFPFQGNYVFVICIGLIMLINAKRFHVSNKQIVFICSLFIASSVLSLYWQDVKLVTVPIYFVLGALGVLAMTKLNKVHFVIFMTNILLMLLFGAFVGFFYAMNGGGAIAAFSNPDGRINQLFLTTLSNTVIGNFIRPSAIFDEPGAFSFFICFIAATRHVLELPKQKTWILMIGGLITFSIAHVVYLIAHFLSEKIFSRGALLATLLIVLFATLIVFANPKVMEVVNSQIYERSAATGGAVDTRMTLLMNAFNNLDARALLFGVNSAYVTTPDTFSGQHVAMGENPLAPIVLTGMLGSMPYYLMVIWLLAYGIKKKKNLVFVGLGLLLLQRPYVMNFGYALLIYFAYNLSLHDEFSRKNLE